MKVCIVSFKECWCDGNGRWYSTGGFPLQMAAIASLFDEVSMVVVEAGPKKGGVPLPAHAEMVPLRSPAGKNIRRKLDVLLHLPYFLKKIAVNARKADVVHVPLPGDIPFLAMLVALVLRKQLIARYGGSWHANSETTFMNRLTKTVMKFFTGNRNVMLATGDRSSPPAPGMNWVFVTALSQENVNAVKPDIERGLHTSPRLVYIGRLSQEKGADRIIKAAGILKREKFEPLPQVDIIGDGPLRASLETLVMEEECSEYIRFTGQLDREELSQKLLEMDICVQPSLTEGFSKAWLDAMLHGLPVISSEVGAASGVIGKEEERGWLVPPGDVPALAEKIRFVITHEIDWTVIRKRCREYVEAKTLEAWTQKIGQTCARQWGMELDKTGKLRRASHYICKTI